MGRMCRCTSALFLSAVLLACAPAICAAAPRGTQDAATQAPTAEQLEALAGAYTSAAEPDVPVSIYVQDGKLTVESEREVPVALVPVSNVEFMFPGTRVSVDFTLDNAGRGASVAFSSAPKSVFNRTGAPVRHVFHDYERSDSMIPMRDGVKLHVVVLKPSDISEPLPILMQRTPYGCEEANRASFFATRPELARDGYIYVCADIRGRFESKGEFVMSRPLADHHDAKAIDESTDAYDTVEWLIKNVQGNNGRVGVVGTSYPGFLAMMAGIDPNPAVKAISPQAPMIDVWMGDDFFHNGAFRQSYGYDYVFGMEQSKQRTNGDYGKDENGHPVDGFDYFLKRGNFAEDVKQSGTKVLPTWKLFLDHPAYDVVWRSRGVENFLNAVQVPTLTVGGYYDQEDMYGPEIEYAKLEPHDLHHENFLVLGPWRHGYWSASTRNLGNLQFGQPIGKQFRPGGYGEFSNRVEHLEVLQPLSAAPVKADGLVPGERGPAELDQAGGAGYGELCEQPCRSDSIPAQADSDHLQPGFTMVQLAD
jgi:hypothetical protein